MLQIITDDKVGDVASIAGVLISLVGFAITIVGVVRSKAAADRAEVPPRLPETAFASSIR